MDDRKPGTPPSADTENEIRTAALDIVSCDQEPIHIPGSIQPHGVMIVAGIDDQIVRQVAGDVEGILGFHGWEGKPLSALFGEQLALAARTAVGSGISRSFLGQLRVASGALFDVGAHASPPYVIVEVETPPSELLPASFLLNDLAAATDSFERATSTEALCDMAAIEFRRLTGFDRVMVYRFLDDQAGRVVAEDRRPDMRSFLNQHFPGSDIPRQARELYLRNLIRVIPDASYVPCPLRPAAAIAELDMSDSSLRSVSPIHLQYLRNMDVSASASVSIVLDGALWGLIACHHDSPRALTYEVRTVCCSLAGSLGHQIKAKEEAEVMRQRIRLRALEDDIVSVLAKADFVAEALSGALPALCRMIGSDGAAVLRGGELVVTGACPADAEIRALAKWIADQPADAIMSTDRLADLYPPADRFMDAGSGVLGAAFLEEEPFFLFWFNAGKAQTVEWAGNPHKDTAGPGIPLAPRASFDAWRQTVRGRARPWTVAEIDAAGRLRNAVLDLTKSRRTGQLNAQLTATLRDKDSLLQQKEFLIGEINHRVQNSLQLVGSFLGLQANASKNPETHDALEEAQRRLGAVALVHRRLYGSDEIEFVDAARYVAELCADTFSFMGDDWARHFQLRLAPVTVSTDRAIPIGLALTELLINVNKYAYDGRPGPVEIGLTEDSTHFRLVVADSGIGRSSDHTGFGSRIIAAMVRQLEGTIAYTDNQPGLRVEITVPLQMPPRVAPAYPPE